MAMGAAATAVAVAAHQARKADLAGTRAPALRQEDMTFRVVTDCTPLPTAEEEALVVRLWFVHVGQGTLREIKRRRKGEKE